MQREVEEEEEEEEDGENLLQGKSKDYDLAKPTSASISTDINSLRGGGQSLSVSSRAFFEPRFGLDFSMVRLHTGNRAGELTGELNARAFTVGRDIVVGRDSPTLESAEGKKLLAHELTHTIQQQGGGRNVLRASRWLSAANPSIQRQGALNPPVAASCNPAVLQQIVGAAIPALADAQRQLRRYFDDQMAVELLGTTPSRETRRIGSALEWNIHTRDTGYALVVADRLAHMEQLLTAMNPLTVRCANRNDQHCALRTFSQSTAAYAQTNLVVFCRTSTANNDAVDTLIHELSHAVIPAVGSKAAITAQNPTPIDRAYTHQRAYRYLTTEEALHNADTYNTLVRHLVDRRTTAPAAPVSDRIRGFSRTAAEAARRALARAEQWNYSAYRWIEAAKEQFQNQGSLSPPDTARITPYFSPVNQQLLNDLTTFFERITGQYRNTAYIDFSHNATKCAGSALGFARGESVTSNAVNTLASASRDFMMYLCSAWSSETPENQIRALSALFILSRPNWMTQTIVRGDVYKYVDLARTLNNYVLPAPIAQSALEHLIADVTVP